MMQTISIANTEIRQINGLYSLNDLHKASGGAAKHQPSNWLRNQQTIDLIDAIDRSSNLMNPIETIRGGLNQGTFVSEELVISYGMWINAEFALAVIRCFLDSKKQGQSNKLTAAQKQQIQEAVRARHYRTGEHWQEIYHKLHAYLKVNSYHDIAAKDFQKALDFLSSIKNAPETLSKGSIAISREDLELIEELVLGYARLDYRLFSSLREPLRLLGSPLLADLYKLTDDKLRRNGLALLERLTPPEQLDALKQRLI